MRVGEEISWGATMITRVGEERAYLVSVDAFPRSPGLQIVAIYVRPRDAVGRDMTGDQGTWLTHRGVYARDAAGARPAAGLEVPAGRKAGFPGLELMAVVSGSTTGWFGIAAYRVRYRVGSPTGPIREMYAKGALSFCVFSDAQIAVAKAAQDNASCRAPGWDGAGLPPGSTQPDVNAALRTNGLPLHF